MSTPVAATELPLLDAAEIAALIARGHRLARAGGVQAAEGGRHGGSASRRLGGGLDFAEHRRYQPGDDPRRMDWRLTARLGQPHIRRYHEDLVPDCILLVDRRATMRFATRGQLKAAQAVRLALLLAAWQAARQAQVTVIELDTGLQRHGPLADPQLPSLARHLARPCPPIAVPGPLLAEALVRIDHDAAAGSRLVLLSDFADAGQIPAALWHRLARRHRVQAVAIEDPAESQPPTATGANLCWPGPGGEHCEALAAPLHARIADEYQTRHADLTSLLRQAGIELRTLRTIDEDPLRALGKLA